MGAEVRASTSQEVFYENSQFRNNLFSENLLGAYYDLKRNPKRQMDLKNDDVIDLGEFNQTTPTLN